MPNITIITIGDELLIGQVVDTNAAFMASELNSHGLEVQRKMTIADTLPAIKESLAYALQDSDVVLMTGGLGPTRDDVTKTALAQHFGVSMAFSDHTWERLQGFFRQLGRDTTPSHREQCYMPANAELLTNKMGTAPGMWLAENGQIVVSMPGVPYEMKYLMQHEVIPRLLQTYTIAPIAHRTLLTTGEGESRLAAMIEDIEMGLPAHLKLAYLPNLGQVRLRLTGRANDFTQLQADLQTYGDAIRERLPAYVFGEGENSLPSVVGQLLKTQGKTIGTAESCTGGLVANLLTSIPGSSAYFHGSVVAYDNRIKQSLLNVQRETLEQHGAVSEATVREMVTGLRKQLDVDLAIAVSGIAGPGGGSPEKPVGTIWLAVGDGERTITQLINGTKDREKNIEYAANRALGLTWRFLMG